MKRINGTKGVERIISKVNIGELIDTYQNLVFSICYKLTKDYFAAQDLAQETFLSVYRHWYQFDGTNEKAWICRIATNKSMDYLKASARKIEPVSQEELEERGESMVGPENQFLEQEVRAE
ncbi:MAG: sigma-70 family RNA polymerase sigma factor [Lachnospiraceae bacterium]|nr:sigma-70 family RNA polymerase sigma factor [Lachnospiraceae bacterium]